MKKRTLFSKQVKSTDSQPTTKPETPGITSAKWYQCINDCPLSAFEGCLLKQNLSALIIEGFPTPVELNKAWENILQEYSEALGQNDYKLYLKLYKDVEVLRIKYEMIKMLIATLRVQYSLYFCNELNLLLKGSCAFNQLDMEAFQEDLNKSERRSKAIKIRLDLLVIEFDVIKQKYTGGGKKTDQQYFTSVLIILSRHNGYRITKDIMVNEYCEHMKQFTQFCEQQEKSNQRILKRNK